MRRPVFDIISWLGFEKKVVEMCDITPDVSVLIPICNVEKYLNQCLDSALQQTLANIEIICINDGSTDGSLDIINYYVQRDARIKVINKSNSGYGDSMNKGLEIARGRYIAILESDDFLDKDALEYMVKQADQQMLEVFKCNFWLYWSKATAEHQYRNNLYFNLASPEMVLMGPHSPVDYPYVFWSKASIWSAIYRRDFLERNNIRFLPTPGASYQDAGFTFKVLACAKRMAYSSRAFLHYRQDNEKSSVNSKGKVFCTCDEHAEMLRFLTEDRPDLMPSLDPIRAHVKFLNYRWNYDRLGEELKEGFLVRFSEEMKQEIERGSISPAYFDGSIYKKEETRGFSYFEPWEIKEVLEIVNEPRYYAARRSCEGSPSKKATLLNYWKAGGMRFVMKALLGKR